MRHYIGYITRDDVNAALAHRVELSSEFKTVHADCEDGLPNVQLVGLVYDLDCMWPEDREHVLHKLQAADVAQKVAVHSYNLDNEDIADLESRGILVYRRFVDEVFLNLADVAVDGQKAA